MVSAPTWWAIFWLRVGSAPFVVALVWAACSSGEESESLVVLRTAVVTLAGCILAFVGGKQQAVAVACGRRSSRVLVRLGIGAAILAACAVFACATSPRRFGPAAANALAASYLCQAVVEAWHPAWAARPALLVEARAPSMAVAVAALAALGGSGSLSLAAGVAVLAARRPAATTNPPRAARPALFEAVVVGSTNPVKVRAVGDVVAGYPDVVADGAVARGYDVNSGIPEQPVGLDVVAAGARNRAVAAHAAHGGRGGSTLAFGLESGLFELDGRHLDACVASAFDGATHSLGVSCAFEIPPDVLRHVLDDGMDLSEASASAGLGDADIGKKGGLIAVLTRGRVTRTDYTAQAVKMALAPREHALPPRTKQDQ